MSDLKHKHFREPFSASYEIRSGQHDELEDFLENRILASQETRSRFFRPDYVGPRRYRRSLEPYRRMFKQMIGYPGFGRDAEAFCECEPSITRFEEAGQDDVCTVYRTWIEVAEGLSVYGLYLQPKQWGDRVPLVIACHGGGGCPEAICDLDTREVYHSFGAAAVEQGYAVWAPFILMTVGYGGDEAREKDRYFMDSLANLVGMRIVGIEVFKILRGLRALMRERPEIDPSRIGMAGLSYGGYFTLCCGAASPLIRASVVAGIFQNQSDEGSSARRAGRVSDTALPGVLETFDLAVCAGMICPRPLLIQNGKNDTVIPVESARKAVPTARRFYERIGVAERFEYDEHNGSHEFENRRIFAFLAKHLS